MQNLGRIFVAWYSGCYFVDSSYTLFYLDLTKTVTA